MAQGSLCEVSWEEEQKRFSPSVRFRSGQMIRHPAIHVVSLSA